MSYAKITIYTSNSHFVVILQALLIWMHLFKEYAYEERLKQAGFTEKKTEIELNSSFKNKQDCYKEEIDQLFFKYTKGWMRNNWFTFALTEIQVGH